MADYPNPSDWFAISLPTTSNNFPLSKNKQYDNFVKSAASDLQPDRRDQEYRQAQKLLATDLPVAVLAPSGTWSPVRPYVRRVAPPSLDVLPRALPPADIFLACPSGPQQTRHH